MADVENYTSLQEFTEEISPRGNKPILNSSQGREGFLGVKMGPECLRGQAALVVFIALLASICGNIVLGVLLYNSPSPSPKAQAQMAPEAESPSLPMKLSSLTERYSLLCRDYTALGNNCSKTNQVRRCRPCPEGWLHNEDKCYSFSEDKLDWEHSRDSCASMGSYLTILHNQTQHDVLDEEARKVAGFDYHFWIGLSDMEDEGVWKWVDNTPVNKTYWSEWDAEPNNHQSGGVHGEDCAVLNSRSKMWFDVPCDNIYKRICEMDAININIINKV